MVKAAYARRRKDAEKRGDEAALAQVVYAWQSLSNSFSFSLCMIVVRSEHSKQALLIFLFQLEKAYDKIMMSQLTKRKKGVTFGSFKVLFFCFKAS